MNRKRWGALLMCGACVLALGTATAQKMDGMPTADDPLHVRMAKADDLIRANHWIEGVILTGVVFPPAGSKKLVSGNHEDVAGRTAVLLAAYSYRYAVTKDPKHKKAADDLMDGILRLEKVTGVPGLAARGFYKTNEPLWHEQAYFFPNEWHDSPTMPGYRWLGDLSSDKFTGFFYGLGVYWRLCADEEHKKLAADFLDRFVGRCVDYNYKLVDLDRKMTLWGNFCPDLPHEPLNALEMLAGLKTAYHLTGKDRYRASYSMLIEQHDYDEEAIMAKKLWPEEWNVPWDDKLAMQSLWMLMVLEEDPALLQKYRMSMNRHYYAWKGYDFNYGAVPWYLMCYQVLTGEEAVDERAVEAIKNMQPVQRSTRTFTVPGKNGPERVESVYESVNTDMIRGYWFGRYHGIIGAEW